MPSSRYLSILVFIDTLIYDPSRLHMRSRFHSMTKYEIFKSKRLLLDSQISGIGRQEKSFERMHYYGY